MTTAPAPVCTSGSRHNILTSHILFTGLCECGLAERPIFRPMGVRDGVNAPAMWHETWACLPSGWPGARPGLPNGPKERAGSQGRSGPRTCLFGQVRNPLVQGKVSHTFLTLGKVRCCDRSVSGGIIAWEQRVGGVAITAYATRITASFCVLLEGWPCSVRRLIPNQAARVRIRSRRGAFFPPAVSSCADRKSSHCNSSHSKSRGHCRGGRKPGPARACAEAGSGSHHQPCREIRAPGAGFPDRASAYRKMQLQFCANLLCKACSMKMPGAALRAPGIVIPGIAIRLERGWGRGIELA